MYIVTLKIRTFKHHKNKRNETIAEIISPHCEIKSDQFYNHDIEECGKDPTYGFKSKYVWRNGRGFSFSKDIPPKYLFM